MNGLKQAGLLEIRKTEMNGIMGTEIRFAPGAAQYITKFFTEATDPSKK